MALGSDARSGGRGVIKRLGAVLRLHRVERVAIVATQPTRGAYASRWWPAGLAALPAVWAPLADGDQNAITSSSSRMPNTHAVPMPSRIATPPVIRAIGRSSV